MILLTGASGFFGKYLVTALIASDRKFISIGRSCSHQIVDLAIEVPQIPTDITTVIHAAGKAHSVPRTKEEAQEFYQVNVGGTLNLLKALDASLVLENFIFISTVAVYGRTSGKLIDEESPLMATDPYGLSKIKSELLIKDWCTKHGVLCTIFRLPLIAGVNPPGNLRSMINGIKKGYYFDIAGGRARKSIVLASDVAKIIAEATHREGVFNLTDGYNPSMSELSEHIAKQLGKSKPKNIPPLIGRIIALFGDIIGSKAPLTSDKLSKMKAELTFDYSKAKNELGWDPTPVLEGFKIE